MITRFADRRSRVTGAFTARTLLERRKDDMGDFTDERAPVLRGLDRIGGPDGVSALVLVLHGGRAHSVEPTRRRHLAVLRTTLLAAGLGSDRSVPVLTLRYRYRGWNDAEGTRMPDPVRDALTALELIEGELGPVPVILVGHSMGGRTAIRVASHSTVRAVAALAPWLPDGESVAPLAGRDLLIAHGREDRVTSSANSIAFAGRAVGVAGSVYLRILEDGHAMLRDASAWRHLVAAFVAVAAHGPQAAVIEADRLDQ